MACNDNWWCICIENFIDKELHLTKQTNCDDCRVIPPPEIHPPWVENNSGLVGHSSMPQYGVKMNWTIEYNDTAGEIFVKQIGICPVIWKLTYLF